MSVPDWTRLSHPVPHPTEDVMPSELFLLRRVQMLERQIEHLENTIAKGVVMLHGNDGRLEVADFLEREAAPW